MGRNVGCHAQKRAGMDQKVICDATETQTNQNTHVLCQQSAKVLDSCILEPATWRNGCISSPITSVVRRWTTQETSVSIASLLSQQSCVQCPVHVRAYTVVSSQPSIQGNPLICEIRHVQWCRISRQWHTKHRIICQISIPIQKEREGGRSNTPAVQISDEFLR